MATLEGVDYAYDPPGIRALQDAGKRFVIRYITDPGPTNKGCSRDEFASLAAAGLRVAFVWEEGARAVLGGFEQGRIDAANAQANLRAVGADPTRPIFFAVDFDATPAQQVPINAYFEGVASVIGIKRTGVYGGYWPVSRLQAARLVTGTWQTYAWSGANSVRGRDFYQYDNGVSLGGGLVDLCRSYTGYGLHGIGTGTASNSNKPASKPKPVSNPVPVYYRIQSGDTLDAIAARFHVSESSLVRLNSIRNPNLIYATERLRIK